MSGGEIIYISCMNISADIKTYISTDIIYRQIMVQSETKLRSRGISKLLYRQFNGVSLGF